MSAEAKGPGAKWCRMFGHLMIKRWKHLGVCLDGQPFRVDGVNVWKHDWTRTDEKAEVKDPRYHQDFVFDVWTIDTGKKTVEFAAGEFSNCIWGFYTREKD